ncbi:hypothetical protein L1887_36378 [Cichorium endivia]|nr:hypothetical protein L1887_36378 [Cichorium endivia]
MTKNVSIKMDGVKRKMLKDCDSLRQYHRESIVYHRFFAGGNNELAGIAGRRRGSSRIAMAASIASEGKLLMQPGGASRWAIVHGKEGKEAQRRRKMMVSEKGEGQVDDRPWQGGEGSPAPEVSAQCEAELFIS